MKRVLLLLADGFEIYEASVFMMLSLELLEGNRLTELFTCVEKRNKSTFNQTIIVDYTLDEVNVEEFDAIAIPAI